MIPDDLNPGALRHSKIIHLAAAGSLLAAVTLSRPEILTLVDGKTERDAVLLGSGRRAFGVLQVSRQAADHHRGRSRRYRLALYEAGADQPVPIKLEHINTPLIYS